MLSKIKSAAVIGVTAHRIDVEVDITSRGLPYFSIVGLPDTAVKESKDRVRAALKNIGFNFPLKQITINLAPADLKKEGAAFDLPIALGILVSEGVIPSDAVRDYLVTGELSLDGDIRSVRGVLSMAILVRDMGLAGMIIPQSNGMEAAVVRDVAVHGLKNLSSVIDFFMGRPGFTPVNIDIESVMAGLSDYDEDFADVKGQEHIKRALEVAAAGAHNLIMIGPPGSGKTMLARRIPSILPGMTFEEAIETTKVHSMAGMLNGGSSIVSRRPFRSPHHTISDVALIGGGHTPRPGEVSLAHNGVLFLDELPEFKRMALEVLRQPLEDNEVTISRATASISYPASFMLVCSMNPCPCGFYGDIKHDCTCGQSAIRKYRSRISGPLLDRIDIHIEVPAVPYQDLSSARDEEPSENIKKRVSGARAIQIERFRKSSVYSNGHMSAKQIKKFCNLTPDAQSILDAAMQRLSLSARAYSRIIKVARTISDLDGKDIITAEHLSEAIQYRTLDRRSYT